MPRYDSLRKTDRDNGIRRFARKHKTWSHQEIADRFGMSRPNISRILGPSKKQSEGGDDGKI